MYAKFQADRFHGFGVMEETDGRMDTHRHLFVWIYFASFTLQIIPALLMDRANLSESYFVDRQDRYLLLSHNRLADFICEMLQALGGACLQLRPDGLLGPPPLTSHPLQGNRYHQHAQV